MNNTPSEHTPKQSPMICAQVGYIGSSLTFTHCTVVSCDDFESLPKFLVADDNDNSEFVVHCHNPRFIMSFADSNARLFFIDPLTPDVDPEALSLLLAKAARFYACAMGEDEEGDSQEEDQRHLANAISRVLTDSCARKGIGPGKLHLKFAVGNDETVAQEQHRTCVPIGHGKRQMLTRNDSAESLANRPAGRDEDIASQLHRMRSERERLLLEVQKAAALQEDVDHLKRCVTEKDARIEALVAEIDTFKADMARQVSSQVADIRMAAEESEFRALEATEERDKALRWREKTERRLKHMEGLMRKRGLSIAEAFADEDGAGHATM